MGFQSSPDTQVLFATLCHFSLHHHVPYGKDKNFMGGVSYNPRGRDWDSPQSRAGEPKAQRG